MKPFMKAAGGKTKLLPEILARTPEFGGTYFEPFVGGGAVFGAIHDREVFKRTSGSAWAVLNDANDELANAYIAVRDHGLELIRKLEAVVHTSERYYAVRGEEPKAVLDRAVRFLYLNKSCFNGLYRVNRAGKFNVPIGSYKNPTIVEPVVMVDWIRALASVEVLSGDFEPVVDRAKKGDFLYADPPYLPRSKTADFTGYTAGKFGMKDHERLAASLSAAHVRGAKFLCSQGDSAAIRALYKDFAIDSVSVRHSVAAKKSSRTKVDEVLIHNSA